jgi:Protein of unknown function (DUF1320)
VALADSYLDIAEFTARGAMPPEDVAALPPAFVETCLQDGSSEINSVLSKRYPVPFAAPVPRVVLRWLTAIVTPELYDRRGWNASDQQETAIRTKAERARAEMQQAADSEKGLWDLPKADAADASAITKGGPFGYSEPDAYTWADVQREAVRG